jgi:hypothetical protein
MTRAGRAAEVLVACRLAAGGADLEDLPGTACREANVLLDLAAEAAGMPGAWQNRRVRP